jgi:hypothetical protein
MVYSPYIIQKSGNMFGSARAIDHVLCGCFNPQFGLMHIPISISVQSPPIYCSQIKSPYKGLSENDITYAYLYSPKNWIFVGPAVFDPLIPCILARW